MPFQPEQNAFRLYEDGTEAGSVAIAAQDTNITRTVDADSSLLLRIGIQESNGGDGVNADDWQLQVSKNAAAYADVSAVSANVKGFNSASLTEGNPTSERLTGGTGLFAPGKISEDGLADNSKILQTRHSEFLYSLTLVAADLANGDTLDFKVLINGGALFAYNIVPRITVSKVVPPLPPLLPRIPNALIRF